MFILLNNFWFYTLHYFSSALFKVFIHSCHLQVHMLRGMSGFPQHWVWSALSCTAHHHLPMFVSLSKHHMLQMPPPIVLWSCLVSLCTNSAIVCFLLCFIISVFVFERFWRSINNDPVIYFSCRRKTLITTLSNLFLLVLLFFPPDIARHQGEHSAFLVSLLLLTGELSTGQQPAYSWN